MKSKIILFFAAFLLGHAALAWVQFRATEYASGYVRQEAAGHGVRLHDVSFRCGGFAALNALRWENIRANVEVQPGGSFARERSFAVTIRKLELVWTALPASFELRARGIRMVSGIVTDTFEEKTGTAERIDRGTLRLPLTYAFWNRRMARREEGVLFHELRDLMRKGETRLALDFQATAFFEIHGIPIEAGILSGRQAGLTFLRIPNADLLTISAVLEEGLTGEEIRILSRRPVLAPQLLKIRNYARTTAYRAGKQNKAVPKDAYRHVLWSYLLTREFGEAFAQEVTNAHEVDPVIASTQAQHKMDFNNNAIGRRYARLGYEEATILSRLLKDPAVIRYSTPQKSF